MDQGNNNIQLVSIPSVGLVPVNMDNFNAAGGFSGNPTNPVNTEFDTNAYIEQEAAKVAAVEAQKQLNDAMTIEKITDLNNQKALINQALLGAGSEERAILEGQLANIDSQLQMQNANLVNNTAAVLTNTAVQQAPTAVSAEAIKLLEAQAMAQAAATDTVSKIMVNNDTLNFQPGLTPGGFVMPVGDQLQTVYKIIAAEGGANSPQEAVNIASTMINRARSGRWNGGNNIYNIATAPNQYVVYQNGSYLTSQLSPESEQAVNALFLSTSVGGPTAHGFSSFRSNGSTSYGGTILTVGGNRYK